MYENFSFFPFIIYFSLFFFPPLFWEKVNANTFRHALGETVCGPCQMDTSDRRMQKNQQTLFHLLYRIPECVLGAVPSFVTDLNLPERGALLTRTHTPGRGPWPPCRPIFTNVYILYFFLRTTELSSLVLSVTKKIIIQMGDNAHRGPIRASVKAHFPPNKFSIFAIVSRRAFVGFGLYLKIT